MCEGCEKRNAKIKEEVKKTRRKLLLLINARRKRQRIDEEGVKKIIVKLVKSKV